MKITSKVRECNWKEQVHTIRYIFIVEIVFLEIVMFLLYEAKAIHFIIFVERKRDRKSVV